MHLTWRCFALQVKKIYWETHPGLQELGASSLDVGSESTTFVEKDDEMSRRGHEA